MEWKLACLKRKKSNTTVAGKIYEKAYKKTRKSKGEACSNHKKVQRMREERKNQKRSSKTMGMDRVKKNL